MTHFSRSESRVEVDINFPLLAGIQASGNVEAKYPVEYRFAISDPAHWPTDRRHPGPVADPPQVTEDRCAVARIVVDSLKGLDIRPPLPTVDLRAIRKESEDAAGKDR